MDKLTAIKIKQNGVYSNEIPLSATVGNVVWDSTYSLSDVIGSLNMSTNGSIQSQLNSITTNHCVWQNMQGKSQTYGTTTYTGGTKASRLSYDDSSLAIGTNAVAIGTNCVALGDFSFAMGEESIASSNFSFSGGYGSQVNGIQSFAYGRKLIANGDFQHVFGQYNVADTTSVEIIGGGTATDARANLRTLDWSGNETLARSLNVGLDITAMGDIEANTSFIIGGNTVIDHIDNGTTDHVRIFSNKITVTQVANVANSGMITAKTTKSGTFSLQSAVTAGSYSDVIYRRTGDVADEIAVHAHRFIAANTSYASQSSLVISSTAGSMFITSTPTTTSRTLGVQAHGTGSAKNIITVNTNNVVDITADTINSKELVYTTTDQSIGGTKTFTSPIHQQNGRQYNVIYFKHTSDTSSNYSGVAGFDFGVSNAAPTKSRFYIEQASFSNGVATGKYELYWMPTTDDGLAASKSYSILTTKSAVTVEQGGTGATTAAAARNNLGINTISIVNGGSKTITLPNGYRGILLCAGTTTSTRGVYSIWCSSAGATHADAMVAASDLSFNTATSKKITISNGYSYTVTVVLMDAAYAATIA